YQWKKNRQNSAAGVGFMRARQPDASAHDRPNPGNEPTAQRYDLQWPSGAMRESQNTESRFKRLVRAANDHQTEMHEGTADEQTDDDEQRQQNDHCGSNSHSSHRGNAVVVSIREQAEGLKTEREQKRHEPSYASADQCVDERFAESALALHYTECFCRPSKHHHQ